MHIEVQRKEQYTIKRLCPFIKDHYDVCYFTKFSSNDIEKAVYYCTKYFETCDIYKEKNGPTHNKFFGDNGGDHEDGDK